MGQFAAGVGVVEPLPVEIEMHNGEKAVSAQETGIARDGFVQELNGLEQ